MISFQFSVFYFEFLSWPSREFSAMFEKTVGITKEFFQPIADNVNKKSCEIFIDFSLHFAGIVTFNHRARPIKAMSSNVLECLDIKYCCVCTQNSGIVYFDIFQSVINFKTANVSCCISIASILDEVLGLQVNI